ncbi:hypothetical protein E4U16_006050 [Claviceps sp. LM84 group G4]|nr:hypothetical protein E4U33_006044 [Claviceps sp. LM78 group G4]KAG6071551.1 hypothetical protein E4U16_006050 [Claviceps sp. LM84 group G4]
MTSIHDVLSLPNLSPDASATPWGPNTTGKSWISVSDWRPWEDFTLEKLTSMYSKVLDAPWTGAQPTDDVSAFDLVVRDELSLVLFLAKYVWPSVNFALEQATVILESDLGPKELYLAPGSWCHGPKLPDWSLISDLTGMPRAKFDNLLPGDAKLSAKWKPAMKLSPDYRVRNQWKLPVSQAATYAKQTRCRYGFLITDEVLVVLRFSKERIDEGLSTTRPTRTIQARSHQRVPSDETDQSSQPISRPNESFGAQSYDDNDSAAEASIEMPPPEYAEIPMSACGKDALTVKFALFCLCLMASSGCGKIDCEYPPFDSWRKNQQDTGYINNTSNLRAESLPKNAILD